MGVNTTNRPHNHDIKHPFPQSILPVPGLEFHLEKVRPDTATGQHVIGVIRLHQHTLPVVGTALQGPEEATPVDRVERQRHRVHVVIRQDVLELRQPAQTRQRIQRGFLRPPSVTWIGSASIPSGGDTPTAT